MRRLVRVAPCATMAMTTMKLTKNTPRRNLAGSLLIGVLCISIFPAIAEGKQSYEQGILLEENLEFPCSHECGPFETVYYSFCVQNGDKVLLGRLFDTRFNYDPNKLRPQIGKAIHFRSDEKNIWMVRPDGKEFRVARDYSKGYYLDGRCIAELHRHPLANPSAARLRPQGVAVDAVYVPQSAGVGYWTKCFLAPDRAIICFARGPKGEEFSHVYQALPEVHAGSDLAVDPLKTNYDTIVLMSGETLVRKFD